LREGRVPKGRGKGEERADTRGRRKAARIGKKKKTD